MNIAFFHFFQLRGEKYYGSRGVVGKSTIPSKRNPDYYDISSETQEPLTLTDVLAQSPTNPGSPACDNPALRYSLFSRRVVCLVGTFVHHRTRRSRPVRRTVLGSVVVLLKP